MSESFDPYLKWLGIRDTERPPNHYRLLGLELFESDPEVINAAADRQMAHVRTFQSGPNASFSQTVLNELAVARRCLLNEQSRADYDDRLRSDQLPPVADEFSYVPDIKPQESEADPPGFYSHTFRSDLQQKETDPQTANQTGKRTSSRRQRDSRAKVLITMIMIPLGGIAGVSVAILLLWVGFGMDPFGLFEKGAEPVAQTSTEDSSPADSPKQGANPTNKTETKPPRNVPTPPAVPKPPTSDSSPKKPKPSTTASQPTPPAGVTVENMIAMPFTVKATEEASHNENDLVPKYLQGATTWWYKNPKTNEANGVLRFTVKQPGQVFLVANWKDENRLERGDWLKQRLTHGQLVEQGWQDLGPAPWDKDLFLLTREVKQGESFAVRTSKYWPPKLVIARQVASSAANKTFAQLEFPAGPQIKPLAVGLPIHSDRHAVWATVPDELKGLQVTQWKCLQGRSDVNVASPGRVVMAASPRWGTAGSGGPWQQELTTEQQLFDDGWVEIATIDVKTDDPNKPSRWTVYEREFQGGEEIRLRTDKYMAPRFFFPASKAPLGEETTNASPLPPPAAIAPFDTDTAKAHQQAWAKYMGLPVEFENSIGLKMRLIPPGQFMMGEDGQHAVTLTRPFYLGIHEVSQREFRKVQNENPSKQVGPENPVDRVTWDDSVAFCQKLSQLPAERKIDRVYRLPTEAEWEYACRAGTTTPFHFGDDGEPIGVFAWDRNNSDRKTHPVGEKRANPWGYHDMLGNVAEWCSDWKGDYPTTGVTDPTGPATGTARIIRGGSYASDIQDLKSGARGTKPLVIRERYTNRGFRVVLPIPDEYFKKTVTALPPDRTMEIKFDDNQGKNATSIPNDQQIKDGFLVIQPHTQVLLGQYFSRFSSIKIRGKIQAPGNDNLRFTAGPVRGILNWEHGGNLFQTLLPAPPGAKHDDRARARTQIKPAALESGKLHEILIAKGEGNKISVSVDGKELFTTEAEFFGTLAIQAENTPIEIESISLTGVIDSTKQASGWSHY